MGYKGVSHSMKQEDCGFTLRVVKSTGVDLVYWFAETPALAADIVNSVCKVGDFAPGLERAG